MPHVFSLVWGWPLFENRLDFIINVHFVVLVVLTNMVLIVGVGGGLLGHHHLKNIAY